MNALRLVLLALFASGTASIINQVIWQRALKLFLGGSEAISSMVVLLVFMAGLGIGSALGGARAGRLARPIVAFGLVEVALFVVNGIVAGLLSLDLSESVYAAERLALAARIPLRLVYATGALALLLPPTILMGATLPLAAEACQRQLGASESRLLTVLLALNTIGACLGALGGSFVLLPYFGQRASLAAAAGCNLLAGSLVLALGSRLPAAPPPSSTPTSPPPAATRRPIAREEIYGFVLGFLSLGFEMVLLRVVALAHEPRPYTFACTLLFFLLFWTFGVALAGRMRDRSALVLGAAALAVALVPAIHFYDRWQAHLALPRGGLAYFLPCLGFGWMYGHLVARVAAEWGRDVGRFYALNTAGSCLGILFFTLVGYEIRHDFDAALIAMGLVGVLLDVLRRAERPALRTFATRWGRPLQGALAVAAVALVGWGLAQPYSVIGDRRYYWGRDGVIEVRQDGRLWIDGLWHSEFSDGASHVGNAYNWMMAVAGVLAHRDAPMTDGLVVGNGLGLTATTLAKLSGMTVDAYEINRTFAEILAAYPKKTLESGRNPRIRIRWQDGRSGLALDPKRYDVIVSAPLHLRAAGSSILLSREYFALLRRRLKPGGVVVLYSQEDLPEQGEVVRATVGSVFPSVESFWGGVLTVASETPIGIDEAEVRARLRRRDPLYREMAAFERALRRNGNGGLIDLFDAKRLPSGPPSLLVSDDHPFVEYVDVTQRLVAAASRRRDEAALPAARAAR